MASIADLAKGGALIYDGSKGAMLQAMGLRGDEASESWNEARPDDVLGVHAGYVAAGSEVIQTNTFPGNRRSLASHGIGGKVGDLNRAGVALARRAADGAALVAASVGPTGGFLEPAGDMTFEGAYADYREQASALSEAGADLINLETFTDLGEMRAAILAARDCCGLPVVASMTFDAGGRTLSGNTPEACAIACQHLGVAMVGANCSGGPESLLGPIRRMRGVSRLPLSVKANAGLPEVVGGKTFFKQTPESFASYADAFLDSGVRLIGGCCGTTPEHIKALATAVDAHPSRKAPFEALPDASAEFVSSPYAHLPFTEALKFASLPCGSGPAMKAFAEGDAEALVGWAADLADGSEDCLFLDFGPVAAFGPAEAHGPAAPYGGMWALVSSLSLSIRKPVAIRAADAGVFEGFLRYYPGRVAYVLEGLPAGQGRVLSAIAKRYGALEVGLPA